jgi:cell division protein FtsW
LLAKAVPDIFPHRVDTWMSRLESFWDPADTEADYQIEKAKIAIANGGIVGNGAGKSVMKNFLPQSSSDFIYAIIIEEYGLLGGMALMFFYLLLLFRIVVVANANGTVFGKLLVVGVGLPIVFQALINMAVAVELFPVTGQTLPLISSGGTSIWMTCLAIGIILSASRKEWMSEADEAGEGETNPLEVLSGQL